MTAPPARCIHEAFAARAAEAPETIAVVSDARRLTYGELDDATNRLAHHLREHGIGSGSMVGIWLDRTPDLLVAILGVLKSGAAYVPLEPSHPRERVAFLLEDANTPVVLTTDDLADRLPPTAAEVIRLDSDWAQIARQPGVPPAGDSREDDLAYVIYTSGSTGRPKGVMIEHRNLVNLLETMAVEPGLRAGEVMVGVTTPAFDLSVPDLHLPFYCGATLVLASQEIASDAAALSELLASARPHLMQATPSTWRMLIDAGWEGDDRLRVVCGGEAFPHDLAAALAERARGGLWNFYGPTEATVWTTAQRVGAGVASGPRIVPIGTPIANATCHVLDAESRPVPLGAEGELYIGGPGVARGYHRRPELTAERFVPDPFDPDGRLYRTGDIVRRRRDGVLEFIGRADFQVKLRGFRIELGEVEAALAADPGVRDAVAVLTDDAPEDRRLVAYVVAEPGAGPFPAELSQAAAKRLPPYMVPSEVTVLDQFPHTPNGKIDRQALAAWRPTPPAELGEHVLPRTPMEELVLGVWTEVLGHDRIGVEDDFFAVGGQSLRAIQVISRLRAAFGVRVPLRRFFEGPTVAELTVALIECLSEEDETAALLAELEAAR